MIWLCFQEEGVQFMYSENKVERPVNYMDRWILSFTQSLIKFVKQEMTGKNNYCKTCLIRPPL